jgi:hypothetical protein
MSWVVIIVLTGFLVWVTVDHAYHGQMSRESHPWRWQDLALVSLLVLFAILTVWQIYLLLKPVIG